ncbi:hypothetical protein AX769_02315 [Frondihabitans sp. PAMC 28766]|uniref:NAD-dependent epimerase/dehydratase family protein n=1 Tax=Frondihabitans sp. PAMC 28766 TaxID=1795630 RepID=UPI00078B48D1|nr:NAD-dependent epimerase/dehydratase family protein [Frondihabitans sp. PAMC 28766]AMM19176.1 hypothetical protein AX769_02315 [Frondihabitans sp. PAMC 28766]
MNNPYSSFAGSRVIITGSAGFIGSALVDWLLEAGAHVIGIDIRQGCDKVGYEHLMGDASRLSVDDLRRLRPDYLFHLASIVGVVEASSDPAATRHAILGMTEQFVEMVAEVEGVRFVYVSSSEVYGQADDFPIVETTPLSPLSAYGQAKRDAETVVLRACADDRLDGVVVRPFNVYGPGQRADFVTSRFIELALGDDDLTLVGGGDQVRTFTYIDDFVDGLLRAAVHTGSQRVFNVAGPETASIAELASIIVDESGSRASVVSVETETLGRPSDIEVRDRIASCDAARRELAYAPSIGIREGVSRMISHRRRGELVTR